MSKFIYVISGGTVQHITPHFAVCAPAYGTVGSQLLSRFKYRLEYNQELGNKYEVRLLNTKMANPIGCSYEKPLYEEAGISRLETNEDVEKLIDVLIKKEDTRCIIMAAAMCDYKPLIGTDIVDGSNIKFGKDSERLSSSDNKIIEFEPTSKIIDKIRKERKDIFLVSFKTTAGLTKEEAYTKALSNLKKSSSNLVFVNDIHNKHNGVVTPEEYPYWEESREDALDLLTDMTLNRLELTFKRTVVPDPSMRFMIGSYDDEKSPTKIPVNFLEVLKHLIDRKAFKPFNGKTTGHFGCKILDTGFALEYEGKRKPAKRLCSRRKMDHNKVFEQGEGLGVVYGKDSKGNIIATGGKPSVGEHTQDLIYKILGDAAHSIVHFHCPLTIEGNEINQAEQKPFECGSNECGSNTASNIREYAPGLFAVHLKGHGPNIAFHKDVPTKQIIEFIEKHWDLDSKTGGEV